MQTIGHTKFREFCAALKQSDLAPALETTSATVSRWASGKATPSDDKKRLIERVTQGAVKAADWLVLEEDAA